jgi:hypothetical protein
MRETRGRGVASKWRAFEDRAPRRAAIQEYGCDDGNPNRAIPQSRDIAAGIRDGIRG